MIKEGKILKISKLNSSTIKQINDDENVADENDSVLHNKKRSSLISNVGKNNKTSNCIIF